MFYEFDYTSQVVIAGFLNHQQYVKETNKKHLVMFSASPIATVWGNIFFYIHTLSVTIHMYLILSSPQFSVFKLLLCREECYDTKA